jgi:hypothetical protein
VKIFNQVIIRTVIEIFVLVFYPYRIAAPQTILIPLGILALGRISRNRIHPPMNKYAKLRIGVPLRDRPRIEGFPCGLVLGEDVAIKKQANAGE